MQVYHPNIDLEGNVCLNILREDWKPVLSISAVIYGLQFLFLVRASSAIRCSPRAYCPGVRQPSQPSLIGYCTYTVSVVCYWLHPHAPLQARSCLQHDARTLVLLLYLAASALRRGTGQGNSSARKARLDLP